MSASVGANNAVLAFGRQLGMDVQKDTALLWIAQEAML